jgi:hypothetical protein
MEIDIKNTLLKYIEAYYTTNFEMMYDLLYEDDVLNWKNKVVEIALRLEEFGETDAFLEKLNFKTISQIKKLSAKEFIIAMLEISKTDNNQNRINQILENIEITGIEDATFLSIVNYQFPVQINNANTLIYKKNVEMMQTRKGWKILFKPGLGSGLLRWQEELDNFQRRTKHDNLSNFKFEGDLERYTITGYTDFSSRRIVIEPRFKYAGEFSDGLAVVQVMKKYGYINTKGEIKIKTQYDFAHDFSQNIAAVQIENEEKIKKWGFINRRGKIIIEPIFDKVKSFHNNFCAVKMGEKWGYIDKKGLFLKECVFDKAGDFDSNSAFVTIKENGQKTSYRFYKNGNLEKSY